MKALACRGLADRLGALDGRLQDRLPQRWRHAYHRGDPMRVLIADDTALLRQGLARLLTEAGIEVCRRGRRRSGTPAAGRGTATRCGGGRHPDAAHQHRRGPRRRLRRSAAATQASVCSCSPSTSSPPTHCGWSKASRAAAATSSKTRSWTPTSSLARSSASPPASSSSTRELIDSPAQPPAAVDPLDELTDREHEVLALMAEGLTDRGIGERLWISTNTVETHVRHILQKLNLRHDDARNRRVQAVLIQLSD